MIVRALVVCLGLGAAAATQDAPDTQLGDWVFAMPKDWTIASDSTYRPVLKSRKTPPDFTCFAHALPTAAIEEAKFPAWFEEVWQTVAKQHGVGEADPAEGEKGPAGFQVLARAGLGKRDWKPALVMAMALHRDGRAGALTFVSNDRDRFAADIGAVGALLKSATLASARAKEEPVPKLRLRVDALCTPSFLWDPAPEPIRGDGVLNGLYRQPGMRLANRESLTSEPEMKYFTFFPDGRLMRLMPPEGLLSFRYEHWQQANPFSCGRYTVAGDEVTITLARPQGEAEIVTFKREGDTLVRGTARYTPAPASPAKPEGRWLRTGWRGRDERFRLGITFGKDGTFKDEGFGCTMRSSWWCSPDYLMRDMEAGPQPGAGSWRIEKNSLELIYADGRKRRYGYDSFEQDGGKYLVLNGDYLERP